MDDRDPPLVSLGLPLYKSRRFLDVIIENLETIEYPSLEILISDRHCADDALDVLQARYAADPRMRFFRSRDAATWLENYNFLLRAARGKYFLWTPHDDSFPADYVRRLVDGLERCPEAMIAVGGMEALYADGSRKMFPESITNDRPWTMRTVFHMYLSNSLWLAFHGAMRREELLAKGMFLRPTHGTVAADLVWDFAAALLGRFVWVDGCHYQKRYHLGSTHALWEEQWRWLHLRSEISALRAYLDRPDGFQTWSRAQAGILFWACIRGGKALLRSLRVFDRLHPPIRDALLSLTGRRG